MFRSLAKRLLPNPLDWKLKQLAKRGGKKVLLGWNRGLGDIALGLYAIVHRIRELVPNAEITFLTRENLLDGFSMLENVKAIGAPDWKRGQDSSLVGTLRSLNRDPKEFDLLIEKPSPTDWVAWQRGVLTPKLKWDASHALLWKKFGLQEHVSYIGIQPVAETNYGLWRNWPLARWQECIALLETLPQVKVLLFGFGKEPVFSGANVIDLRGKTTLFELLSILKTRCKAAILPDSGILSMLYYLDASFPMHLISLWADPNHGILKQKVLSPNKELIHTPLIGNLRDLSSVSAQEVVSRLFPARPLQSVRHADSVLSTPIEKAGAILLAGGQGSRLGVSGPKGIFSIREKSLFQWILEKAPNDFPIAIMTSPINHAETVAFFEKHTNFGKQIHFFQQTLLSVLDEKRRPIGVLAPDGNGSVFKAFKDSGLLELFEKQGVEQITILPVENPLADPADPLLLSVLRQSGADAIIKCMERTDAEEKTGVLVERMGRLEIVEYTELEKGVFYPYAYTGMMALTLPNMRLLASIDLPIHWVEKKIQTSQGERLAWKGERFIFDALPYLQNTQALCYCRDTIYAPLKSLENLYRVEKVLS